MSEHQQDQNKPVTYSIRLAVKTPSKNVQYRMLEADVTVTGTEDPDLLRRKAREALVLSLAETAITMGESPPEEVRSDLEELYDEETISHMYPGTKYGGVFDVS